MKELAIGEEIRIRCVEDKSPFDCQKCVFLTKMGQLCKGIKCVSEDREDGKDVHFELVED